MERWTGLWWETSVVLLALNSVLFGFLGLNEGNLQFAIWVGFVPGALLVAGLVLRSGRRPTATVMLVLGSVGAALAFWVVYTVVLALVIVVGGFLGDRIGPTRWRRASVA